MFKLSSSAWKLYGVDQHFSFNGSIFGKGMAFKWSSSKLSLGDGVQRSGGQRFVDDARWMMCDKCNSQYH